MNPATIVLVAGAALVLACAWLADRPPQALAAACDDACLDALGLQEFTVARRGLRWRCRCGGEDGPWLDRAREEVTR